MSAKGVGAPRGLAESPAQAPGGANAGTGAKRVVTYWPLAVAEPSYDVRTGYVRLHFLVSEKLELAVVLHEGKAAKLALAILRQLPQSLLERIIGAERPVSEEVSG